MRREAFVVSGPNHRALRALNYSPAVDALRRAGTSSAAVPIGRVVSELGLGYATVFARIDCAPEHGVELLSQSDMFAAEPVGRWIRRDSMKKPESHEVRPWQILIAGAGTLGENELYGRPVLADERLAGKYVGQDTLVLAFDPPGGDLNLYTYAFLASPTGLQALRSTSYGTKILRIRKDLLGELPIPQANDSTVRRVAALVRRAVVARSEFASKAAEARAVIDGRAEMVDALAMCGTSRARCLAWSGELPTMSAWTFASTGGALALLSKRWNGRLGDIVPEEGLFNGPRFARVSVRAPHGIEFMSQRDVFLMNPIARRIAHPGFASDKLFVPEGTLLVGGHGTLGEGEIFGRCVHVTDRLSRSAFTQDLLRVQAHAQHAGMAFAWLSTTVGFRLLRSCAVGTKILSLRPDLLRALPVPDLTTSEATAVRVAVDASCRAREEAGRCESEAIRIIEEEVLPQWLA